MHRLLDPDNNLTKAMESEEPAVVEEATFAASVATTPSRQARERARVHGEKRESAREHKELTAKIKAAELEKKALAELKLETKKEEAKLKTHSGYPNVVEMRENKAGDPSDKNPEGAYNLTDFY